MHSLLLSVGERRKEALTVFGEDSVRPGYNFRKGHSGNMRVNNTFHRVLNG